MGRCVVLDGIRAFDDDGRELTLVSQPQRRLVAVLCINFGRFVRSAVLEEHLDLSPGALRTSVSRLRRTLGPEALVTTSAGYQLRGTLDVDEFERAVRESRDLDAGRAMQALERAQSLWRGTPYDEFAAEVWAEIEVQRLVEVHAAATEELVALLLDRGDDGRALELLMPIVERHPYRDLPRALWIRALAQVGRTTEALRQFQTYRALLRDDIGVEPSAMLVELERAILAGGDVRALRSSGHPAWAGRQGRAANVPTGRARPPTPLSTFVGRVRETAEVVALLDDHRVVTLVGAGGCGKSRLALRVATALTRDGDGEHDARWIDLGVLPPDGDVAEMAAIQIGTTSNDPGPELVRRLRDRPTLLVFDNAEHVIEATSHLVNDLLTQCPTTRALVTSREPLGLAGEVVWRVPPLGLPEDGVAVGLDDLQRHDAIRLFLTRAREARPGMAIDQPGVEHVVAICAELDGIPLALELAAARLRTMPLVAVAESVKDIVRWTAAREGTFPGRHSTLRASISWSFHLIDTSRQEMLVRLSAFRGWFDADAAAAVAGTSIDDMSRLVDVGLVQLEDDRARYRLLHTVRQFCADRAAENATAAATTAAHARYFTDWCTAVGDGKMGLERRPFVRQMPDVVAAMEWAREHDPQAAFRMCRDLAPIRTVLGYFTDFAATWTWLMNVDIDQRDELWRDAVAGSLATATALLFDTAPAVDAIVTGLVDERSSAGSWLRRGRAMVPAYGGRPTAIVDYIDGLADGRDDLEASVYVGFGAYMLALMGRIDEADPLLERLRRLTRRHGTAFSVDSVGNGYAAAIVTETLRGDLAAAGERGRRAVPTDPAFSMTSAAALAHAALLARDRAAMQRALEWSKLGSFPLLGFLTPFTGACAALLDGQQVEAADLVEEFWIQAAPVPVWRVFAVPVVVGALVDADRLLTAESVAAEAGALLAAMEHSPYLTASRHLGDAMVALAHGDLDAVRLAATAARDLARTAGLALAAVDAAELLAAALHEPDASSWRSEVAAERRRLGYHFSLVAAHRTTPTARLLVPRDPHHPRST